MICGLSQSFFKYHFAHYILNEEEEILNLNSFRTNNTIGEMPEQNQYYLIRRVIRGSGFISASSTNNFHCHG